MTSDTISLELGIVVSSDGDYRDPIKVHDFGSGEELLSQPCLGGSSPPSVIHPDGTAPLGYLDTCYRLPSEYEPGEPHLRFRNLPRQPWVTATRVFRYRLDDPKLQALLASGEALPDGYELPGEFDKPLTARCPNCGKRFTVPEVVEQAIERACAGLSPEQSPCLHLPETAWDDPALRSPCPHCQQPLRFNPFVAI